MIGIIDYGLGNTRAFLNLYNRLNIPCKLLQTVEDCLLVEKLILPGVGAFDYAMSLFKRSKLFGTVESLVLADKKPILGVCVGMQMLGNGSEEGSLEGLGWLNGEVKQLKQILPADNLPLPHMGWNNLMPTTNHALLQGLTEQSKFYFLHSYYFQPNDVKHTLATAVYGSAFSTVVGAANVYGIQCHPEKSHMTGIKFLENYWKL